MPADVDPEIRTVLAVTYLVGLGAGWSWTFARCAVPGVPAAVARAIASGIGTQMTVFAVALQIYVITGSSAAVGGVGLASAVPGIVVGLLAGSVIDATDRRVIVLVGTTTQMALSVALAAQAFAALDQMWLLYSLVALQWWSAVTTPARRTFLPRLLPPTGSRRRPRC